jgi:hypothetical protein
MTQIFEAILSKSTRIVMAMVHKVATTCKFIAKSSAVGMEQ